MVLEYIEEYRKQLKKCIEDLKHKNTIYKQIPNMLTFSRAALSPISSILFLTGHSVVGVVFTGLLLSTDLFDGKLARKWNVQSKFGADLDAFCDKLMFLWLSLPLIISNSVVLLNFIFEGAISGVNIFGRMKGLNTKTVFSGKVKTCFLSLMLICGYLVQFLNLPGSILMSLIGVTFVSQGVAFSNYVKEYRRLKNEQVIITSKVKDRDIEQIENEQLLKNEHSLVESLKRERNFVLGFNEPEKIMEPNIRRRNIESEKKNEKI